MAFLYNEQLFLIAITVADNGFVMSMDTSSSEIWEDSGLRKEDLLKWKDELMNGHPIHIIYFHLGC